MKTKSLLFVTVIVSLVIFRLFFVNNQSTPEELKKAYTEAVEKVKKLKSPDSDSWGISIWNGSIYYSQRTEYSFRSRKEHSEDAIFSLSKDGKKIILCTDESAFYEEGSWLTAGTAYKKYREFKNAADFTSEVESLLKKRLSKKPEKRLDLTSYYPYTSYQNMKLWFHDDSKKYKYSE